MLDLCKKLVVSEEGQGMAEYGILVAGIALVAIVAIFAFGGKVDALFNGLEFTDGSGS